MGTLPDHVNICQSVGTFSRLFTRPWEHLFACRNIFWVVGTFSSLKEHFLLRGKICQTMATWPNPWENFTELENIYQIMGIFTGPQTFLLYWPWEHLPDRGNITWPWENFPVCGNIFQTMGIFTPPWEYLPHRGKIYPTMGIFAKTWDHLPGHGKIYLTEGISARLWEYLPDRKNICQNISRFSSQFLIFPWPWLLCFSVTWWDWPAATGPCFTGPSA